MLALANAADGIPAGTPISGRLSTELDTAKVNVGDGFSLAVTRPFPNDDVSFSGAFVRGHVARVIRAGQGRKPELDLAFDSITLANGEEEDGRHPAGGGRGRRHDRRQRDRQDDLPHEPRRDRGGRGRLHLREQLEDELRATGRFARRTSDRHGSPATSGPPLARGDLA
jgi:hypothetical protein